MATAVETLRSFPVSARRRVVLAANAAIFANFLTLLGLSPLYPEVAHDLGMRADGLGLYFTIQGAINVLLQLPVGVLADRYGRRPVMALGLLFMATGQVFRWQSANPLIFGIGQIFIGLCGPFIVAACYAVVADAYQGTAGRAQALGWLQAATTVGQGSGFLLSGLLAPFLGWRGYSGVIAFLPLLLLPLTLTQPEPPRAAHDPSFRRATLAAVRFISAPSAAAFAIVAALVLGAGVGTTYVLPFVARSHQINEFQTALLLIPNLAGSALGGPLIGRWADRSGLRTPFMVVLGIGILALAVLGLTTFQPFGVVVILFLVGLATSGGLALATVGMVDLAAHRRSGTGAALGGLRVGQGIGPGVFPLLAGVILVRSGAGAAYLAQGAALLLAAALIALALRRPISG